MCYYWHQSTVGIPAGDNDWGPSTLQVQNAGEYKRAVHVVSHESGSDFEDGVSDIGSWETDGDLAEQVEAVAFHDEYLDEDPAFDSEFLDDQEAVELPRKRRRMED